MCRRAQIRANAGMTVARLITNNVDIYAIEWRRFCDMVLHCVVLQLRLNLFVREVLDCIGFSQCCHKASLSLASVREQTTSTFYAIAQQQAGMCVQLHGTVPLCVVLRLRLISLSSVEDQDNNAVLRVGHHRRTGNGMQARGRPG